MAKDTVKRSAAGKKSMQPESIIPVLRELNSTFYALCFRAGVGGRAHAFIEFNGLMSMYIDLLQAAENQGIDPHSINEHVGVPLPCNVADMVYLGEKLRCIFGPVIDTNPAAKACLQRVLFKRDGNK